MNSVNPVIGIDHGRSMGDHTAVSMRCECGSVLCVTFPSVIRLKVISMDCNRCGRHTPVNFDSATATEQT